MGWNLAEVSQWQCYERWCNAAAIAVEIRATDVSPLQLPFSFLFKDISWPLQSWRLFTSVAFVNWLDVGVAEAWQGTLLGPVSCHLMFFHWLASEDVRDAGNRCQILGCQLLMPNLSKDTQYVLGLHNSCVLSVLPIFKPKWDLIS